MVRGLVLRTAGGGSGARQCVNEITVSVEGGIDGDRWSTDDERTGQDQISLVNIHVLQSIAGEDPEQCARSGDNLQVDLDLSEENLPFGTKLTIGSAVLEVSPQPHVPCEKLLRRYGEVAVKKVSRANRKGRRGRGVLCMVLQAGSLRVGDTIQLKRP